MSDDTIKAVFFDLDDTLFDHRRASLDAIGAVREDNELFSGTPFEEFEREYHRLLEETFERVLAGTLTIEEARKERFRRLVCWCGGTYTPDQVEEMVALYRFEYQKARCSVPGAVALLRYLRPRVAVGIVTNNFAAEQWDKIASCGLQDLIDFMVISEEVGRPKPEPEIFFEALRKAECRADEAVMVGDNWGADVIGARAAGIRAVWLNRDGLPNLDPDLAEEISSFEPPDPALRCILGL